MINTMQAKQHRTSPRWQDLFLLSPATHKASMINEKIAVSVASSSCYYIVE